MPNLHLVQAFLHYQARYKKGRIDEKIAFRTPWMYETEFRLDLYQATGHRYTAQDRKP
jgi:hypothetical protein